MNLSLLDDLHWYQIRIESINEEGSQRYKMNDIRIRNRIPFALINGKFCFLC